MTDKELLKLAAKAAGIELSGGDHGDILRVYFTDPHNGLRRYTEWNPLEDDGDAFRLAVKLQIHFARYDNYISACPLEQPDDEQTEWNSPHKSQNEAARRAIVRAASEIGKNMGGFDDIARLANKTLWQAAIDLIKKELK